MAKTQRNQSTIRVIHNTLHLRRKKKKEEELGPELFKWLEELK